MEFIISITQNIRKFNSYESENALVLRKLTSYQAYDIIILNFDWLDSTLCEKLSEEKEKLIKQYFAENPKHLEKFENVPVKLHPAISTVCVQLNKEQTDTMPRVIDGMAELYTNDFFNSELKKHGLYECVCRPPTNWCVNLFTYLWDIDENYDVLYHKAVLVAI